MPRSFGYSGQLPQATLTHKKKTAMVRNETTFLILALLWYRVPLFRYEKDSPNYSGDVSF